MRQKIKIMTVVGTRPEIIRLSRVMARLDAYSDHVLVHTGQNYDYELNQIFFDELTLRKPDYFLEAAGTGAAETIGNIIARIDPIFEKEKPDAVLVLGDTNSCLSVIAAKKRKIPIFHMEAGNRSFDDRVPEESNRKIVDHLSDINMPYSDIAREYLLREGLAPDRIIKTGSPMYEVLHHYLPLADASDILKRLGLKREQYFVVSCHREENVDGDVQLTKLAECLNGVAEHYKLRMIVSTHPRTRKRLEEKNTRLNALIELLPPMGFPDYIQLQRNSHTVLSDSGTITEEASILNFPALNIRETHERPEGMEESSVMMVGLSLVRVLQALTMIEKTRHQTRMPVKDYMVPNVSDKVLRIILSYTDYVRRVAWKEYTHE